MLPLAAQGGPPLRTDDPGTPGNRNREINISSTQFWSKSEREFEIPLLDINYGLGDRIQLKYEGSYLFDSDNRAPFKGTIGSSLLGVKWRFVEQSNEKGWRTGRTHSGAGIRAPVQQAIRSNVRILR